MQPLGLLCWFSDGTLRFHCKGTSLIPGQRTNITQAMWHSQKKKERKEIYKMYCIECWIPGRTYCKLVMTRGLESNKLALNPASVTCWQCDSGWITHLSEPQFLHLDTLKMPISKVAMRSKVLTVRNLSRVVIQS